MDTNTSNADTIGTENENKLLAVIAKKEAEAVELYQPDLQIDQMRLVFKKGNIVDIYRDRKNKTCTLHLLHIPTPTAPNQPPPRIMLTAVTEISETLCDELFEFHFGKELQLMNFNQAAAVIEAKGNTASTKLGKK